MSLIYCVLSLLSKDLKETTLSAASSNAFGLKYSMMNEKENQGLHEIKVINHFILARRNSKLEMQWSP